MTARAGSRPDPTSHLLVLDLVRCACALLVACYHYATVLPVGPPAFAAHAMRILQGEQAWRAWSWCGWVGVELFFVVSGYVIALSGARGSGGRFLRRRALRLAPAAWICASVTTIVMIAAGGTAPGEAIGRWLASVAFWPLAPQADGAYWTLGLELVFYLVVALRIGRERGNSVAIERIGFALACMTLVYWPSYGGGTFDRLAGHLRLVLVPHGAFFAIGIALCAIHRDGLTRMRLLTLAIGLVGGSVEIVGEARLMIEVLRLGASPALPLGLFYAGVLAIAGAGRMQPALARGGGARAITTLGLMTYPFYLIHQSIGELLVIALRQAGLPSAPAMIGAIMLVAAFAWLVATALEPPLRRALERTIDQAIAWCARYAAHARRGAAAG